MINDATREFVKARADQCCQLFHRTNYMGEDGNPMDIVHRIHSGMGGQSDEHWTNDKKNLLYACRNCHNLLHHPTKAYRIVEMDPDYCEAGVPYPVLDIVDHNGIDISHRDIWLHARLVKEHLGELLTAVRGDRMFEADRAKAMLELYEDYDLLAPDAASPEQMLSSEGFDSEVAMKQIQAAEWIEQHDLEWPRGLVVSKVNKFVSASQRRLWTLCSKETIQAMLYAAVDQSKSDIARALAELGVKIEQPRMYVLMWGSGEKTLARISDLEMLITKVAGRQSPMTDEMSKTGPMVISVQKFAHGFTVKRGKNAFCVYDNRGQEIPFWTDEDMEAEELVGISWL